MYLVIDIGGTFKITLSVYLYRSPEVLVRFVYIKFNKIFINNETDDPLDSSIHFRQILFAYFKQK
jgi:hypothetical protein